MITVPQRYWVVVAVALALRVGWAALVPVEPVSDGIAYDVFAQNLAEGNGYGWTANAPTAFWAPGTAFVYSLLYRFFGHSYLPVVFLNLLLGVWIVTAGMVLAEKWFSSRVSLVTGLVLACWSQLVQFTTILASELIFIAMVLAALLVWEFASRPRWLGVVGLGIILAGASYVRTIGLALPVIFGVLEWAKARSWGHGLSRALVLVMILLLFIAPWSARNSSVFGRFVWLTTDGGAVLWQGITHDPFSEKEKELPRPSAYNEAELDHYWSGLALDLVRAAPMEFVVGFFKRLLFMNSRESIGVVWNEKGLTARFGAGIIPMFKGLNTIYWYSALGLGLFGLGCLVKQRGWRGALLHPAVVMWAGLVLPLSVLSPQDRFHMPGVPFLAMLAACGLVKLGDTL